MKTYTWIHIPGYQINVYGIVTQGDGGRSVVEDWVTSVKISTFARNTSDDETFIINEDGTEMVIY